MVADTVYVLPNDWTAAATGVARAKDAMTATAEITDPNRWENAFITTSLFEGF
jgi:hypothetical protein